MFFAALKLLQFDSMWYETTVCFGGAELQNLQVLDHLQHFTTMIVTILKGQVSSKSACSLFYTECERFTDHKLTSVLR